MNAKPRTELTTLTDAEIEEVSGGAAFLVIYAGLFVARTSRRRHLGATTER